MDNSVVGVPCLARGRIDINLVPFGFGLIVAVAQNSGVILPAYGVGHNSRYLHHIYINGVVHKFRWSAVVHRQPVRQSAGLARQIGVLFAEVIEIHTVKPVHHGLHILFNDLSVTVLYIELPGHHTYRRRPGCSVGETPIVSFVVSRHRTANTSGSFGSASHPLIGP